MADRKIHFTEDPNSKSAEIGSLANQWASAYYVRSYGYTKSLSLFQF